MRPPAIMDNNPRGRANIWSLYRPAGERFGGPIVLPSQRNRLASSMNSEQEIATADRSEQLGLPQDMNDNNRDWVNLYTNMRKENAALRKTVTKQEKELVKLRSLLKTLTSEVDTSKSSSVPSTPPVQAVPPQKRPESKPKPSSSRSSSRRSPSNGTEQRRMSNANQSGVELSEVSAPVRRTSDELLAEVDRLVAMCLDDPDCDPEMAELLRSYDDFESFHSYDERNENRRDNHANPQQYRGNRTFTIHNSISQDEAEDLSSSPGYWLRTKRPDLIRRLEYRQKAIKAATAQRSIILDCRREAALAVIEGRRSWEQVRDDLYADPTRISAFPIRDMKAITKRNYSNTTEYRRSVDQKKAQAKKAANHLIAHCFSQNTVSQLHRSASQPALRRSSRS